MNKILLIIGSILLSLNSGFAQTSANKKLNYMNEDGYDQAVKYAEKEKKPLLVYFNSHDCHQCEKFTSEIMASDTFTSLVKGKFVAVNASINTKDGRKAAERYGLFKLPVLVLSHSLDKNFYFIVQMTMNIDSITLQINSFNTAKNLYDQIMLYSQTNKIPLDSASSVIARNYAKRDQEKNGVDVPELQCQKRTLNIKFFNKFKEIYLQEWEIQKLKPKKKKN